MFRTIYLKNFQSHKDTTLELSKGINCIIGPSDSGKTAILRAIKWAVQNRPQGDSFRRHKSKDVLVTITLDNKQTIERYRDNQNNAYMVDKKTGFGALGTEIPEPITKLFNLSNINIQQQHDSPFLLSNSSGEVARHFNQIAHLDVIDRTLKNLQSGLRQTEQKIISEKNNLEVTEEELSSYEYLDELEEKVIALEKIEQTLISLRNERQKLDSLLRHILRTRTELKKYECVPKNAELVNIALDLFNQKKTYDKQRNRLYGLIDTLEKTKHCLFVEKTTIDVFEKRYKEQFPDVCPLCGQRVKK